MPALSLNFMPAISVPKRTKMLIIAPIAQSVPRAPKARVNVFKIFHLKIIAKSAATTKSPPRIEASTLRTAAAFVFAAVGIPGCD